MPWTPAVEDARLIIADWELSEFLFFLAHLFAQQIVAAALSGGVSPNVGASKRDRIELCIFARFSNAGCLNVTMDNLAKASLVGAKKVNKSSATCPHATSQVGITATVALMSLEGLRSLRRESASSVSTSSCSAASPCTIALHGISELLGL